MKKQILSAIMSALLAASLCACSKNADLSDSETSDSSVSADAESEPAKSADYPADNAQPESGIYRILTSNDPKNFTELIIDRYKITVNCCYENNDFWAVDGKKLKQDGDVLTRTITADPEGEQFFPIMLYRNDGPREGVYFCHAIYLESDENGMRPADSNGRAERNLAVSDIVIELPQQGVKQYIDNTGDEEKIRETLDEIKTLGDEICEGLTDDYDKLRAITMWVRENIYYDFDACESSVTPETVSLSRVLELKRSVCGGFSNLTAALCASQGITCYNFFGTADGSGYPFEHILANPELHEWNMAVIDGRKIWVDAGFCTTNAYRGGVYTEGQHTMDYFDCTNEIFALDHQADKCEHRDYFAVE